MGRQNCCGWEDLLNRGGDIRDGIAVIIGYAKVGDFGVLVFEDFQDGLVFVFTALFVVGQDFCASGDGSDGQQACEGNDFGVATEALFGCF